MKFFFVYLLKKNRLTSKLILFYFKVFKLKAFKMKLFE